jgi:hypothetical protein
MEKTSQGITEASKKCHIRESCEDHADLEDFCGVLYNRSFIYGPY